MTTIAKQVPHKYLLKYFMAHLTETELDNFRTQALAKMPTLNKDRYALLMRAENNNPKHAKVKMYDDELLGFAEMLGVEPKELLNY
jgi:hypothetical protein